MCWEERGGISSSLRVKLRLKLFYLFKNLGLFLGHFSPYILVILFMHHKTEVLHHTHELSLSLKPLKPLLFSISLIWCHLNFVILAK